MTVHLDVLSLGDHFGDFLFSDTDNRLFHPLLITVTIKLRRERVQHFHVHPLQEKLQHFLRAFSLIQNRCDCGKGRQIPFQTRDGLFLRKRHELHDKSPCLSDRVVFFHQDPQPYAGGYLLRGGEIIGQILRNLSCLQISLSYIGLFQSHILDHPEHSMAHCASHIQLSQPAGGQHDLRLYGIALYVPPAVSRDSHSL